MTSTRQPALRVVLAWGNYRVGQILTDLPPQFRRRLLSLVWYGRRFVEEVSDGVPDGPAAAPPAPEQCPEPTPEPEPAGATRGDRKKRRQQS